MRLSVVLPWVCVAGSLAGLAWMYSADQKKEAELTALRADSGQLEQLRTELEEAKKAQTQSADDEVTRLRREHEELLRLRNEVRQLRGEKQQLNRQVQSAQAQAQAQAQNAQAQAEAQAAQAQAQKTAPAAAGAPTPEQANLNACINNLRQIDAAKQQWALEQGKPTGALMTAADLAPYLPNKTVPTCPGGGVYTLNPVGISPICNIPGHALPK
jgi:TolA-binding protein